MPKTKSILIIALVAFVILAGIGSIAYFFGKQTIYGLQGEYKIGDIIKFDAIDTGFTNNANARRPCYAKVTIEKPDNTIVTIASHDELVQSCVGAPCKSYTLPIVGMPLGERTLRVEYNCVGDVGNNGVDERVYNVVGVASTAKSCDDSDGGNNLLVKGTVHWSSVEAQYDYKNDDSCVSDSTIREYQCDSTKKVGYYDDLACPSGTKCQNGACYDASYDCKLYAPTVMPTYYCKDGNVYADIQSVDRQACKLTSNSELIAICGIDVPCSNGVCKSSVELGTERNAKCSDDLKSVDYQYFGNNGEKNSDGTLKLQWIDAHYICLSSTKCSPATNKCELVDDNGKPCATNVGYVLESGQCKFVTCDAKYSTEADCKKVIGTNETKKDDGKETTAFDFKEFMKTYGIGIGVAVVLVIIGLIFGIKAMTKKRKK